MTRSPAEIEERPVLSIVVPAYNEEDNVRSFYERVSGVMEATGLTWEMIFSVDPCPDRTEELILELRSEDRA